MGPNLIALAIPLFFVGIGIEALVGRWQGRRVFRLGDSMADMGCGIMQQLVSTLLATRVMLGAYEWLYTHVTWVRFETPWVSWVVGVFAVEFAYYWWHRLSHGVNLLWAAHVVHHQSEDYNLAVALRQSVTTWATSLPFYLPIALLGVSPMQFGVILSLSTLYQFWIHTELVPPLGRLEYLLNTPALHRVHHAIDVQYLDKNHAATFSWLDVLFKTFVRETTPCTYGTTRPLQSFNPARAQVDSWLELWRASRAAPSMADAVTLWFRSPAFKPSWWPADLRRREGVERYDVLAGAPIRRYCFWQFALTLVAVFLFLMFSASLGLLSTGLSTGWLTLSVVVLPALYEGRPWARRAEWLRWLTAPALVLAIATGL